MAGTAAVCHVSTDQVITQPPARRLLAVPKAVDLPSALRAINILQQNFQIISGQVNNQVNVNPSTQNFISSAPGQKQPAKGRWTEQSRATETVRIFNKDDHDQFIDVKRINSLTMRDNVTGELWNWSLGG